VHKAAVKMSADVVVLLLRRGAPFLCPVVPSHSFAVKYPKKFSKAG
jgi:hypothetical protein